MSDTNHIGKLLIDSVVAIDRRCNKIVDGVEYGLVHVKEQFAKDALRQTGKKLTEELLISWLLRGHLRTAGMKAELEQCYLGSDEWCDLIVRSDDQLTYAIEVKMAWKKCVWCDGSVHRSSNFKGYLLGDASHKGTAHDFKKLDRAKWPSGTVCGVLLIGFDSFAKPMDDKIAELEQQEDLKARGWQIVAHRSWADRRNALYRIACWFWMKRTTKAGMGSMS